MGTTLSPRLRSTIACPCSQTRESEGGDCLPKAARRQGVERAADVPHNPPRVSRQKTWRCHRRLLSRRGSADWPAGGLPQVSPTNGPRRLPSAAGRAVGACGILAGAHGGARPSASGRPPPPAPDALDRLRLAAGITTPHLRNAGRKRGVHPNGSQGAPAGGTSCRLRGNRRPRP